MSSTKKKWYQQMKMPTFGVGGRTSSHNLPEGQQQQQQPGAGTSREQQKKHYNQLDVAKADRHKHRQRTPQEQMQRLQEHTRIKVTQVGAGAFISQGLLAVMPSFTETGLLQAPAGGGIAPRRSMRPDRHLQLHCKKSACQAWWSRTGACHQHGPVQPTAVCFCSRMYLRVSSALPVDMH